MHSPIEFPRRSGILLHPTSLPGPGGIGTLGAEAYRFVDFLAEAGQKLWQILPLLPLGYGNSPYSSPSAFAKNSLLVSDDALLEKGLIDEDDLGEREALPEDRADYEGTIAFKRAVLGKAWKRFKSDAGRPEREGFDAFRAAHSHWLDDYALFTALKEHFGGKPWFAWPREIARREPEALKKLSRTLGGRTDEVKFSQFLFFEQWEKLREYAHGKGIDIIGDIPIFVNHDSADVWASPRYFLVDDEGRLTEQSGCPVDPLTGASQIWGTPLYNWEAMRETQFEWWIKRFSTAFELLDIMRIDHFYGFSRCWHIPLDAKTSDEGRWVETPGIELFKTVFEELGRKPFIAEDLGLEPPPGIESILDYTGFPGIRLLHYAFDMEPGNHYLPHNHVQNSVVYPGLHDHDTTLGWFLSRPPETRDLVLRYLGTGGKEINWDFIRAALSSVAHTAIIPLQDVLGLGSEARMNTPGRSSGQWEWRYRPAMLTDGIAARLSELTALYER